MATGWCLPPSTAARSRRTPVSCYCATRRARCVFRNGAVPVKFQFSINHRRETMVRSRSLGACGRLYRVMTRHRAALGFREDFATGAKPQDGMTQAAQFTLFVDGNNVMGSRPDCWWRCR